MKKVLLFLLILFLLFILGVVFVFGYLGYIPGLSKLLGAETPRDLGVKYTEEDRTAARAKSKVEYTILPETTAITKSYQLIGTRKITASWNSQEMTALMNNRPWKYWPIKDVQLKVNDDGTAEMSGVVIKDKLIGYGQAIGVPEEVITTVVNFLPPTPTFYLKAKTSLEENKVKDFEIQSVYLGKMPLPVDTLMSLLDRKVVSPAYAANPVSELSKYQGKREAIINFINDKLASLTGFYAKKAYFDDGKLQFDGNLSEKMATVR